MHYLEIYFACFIVAKNYDQVSQISDICSLNKYMKQKQYQLLIIISGYNHFTKLNISMQHYTSELDEES